MKGIKLANEKSSQTDVNNIKQNVKNNCHFLLIDKKFHNVFKQKKVEKDLDLSITFNFIITHKFNSF